MSKHICARLGRADPRGRFRICPQGPFAALISWVDSASAVIVASASRAGRLETRCALSVLVKPYLGNLRSYSPALRNMLVCGGAASARLGDWRVSVFAAVQAFGIGLTGLILPPEMQIPLRLTPLNTRFVAALYVAAAWASCWRFSHGVGSPSA